ncbi:PilZ domain-containing protein [Thiohalocapsa marina]|nr:PilZ domain-containing protein [Thiohalocapsa marina]
MEHRWHRRVPIEIPVSLHFTDGAFGPGIAWNICQGGLFVHTSMRAPCNGCLDVRLTVTSAHGPCSVRLPALVVHRNKDGIGLMFRGLDEQAENAVSQLLLAHGQTTGAPITLGDRSSATLSRDQAES